LRKKRSRKLSLVEISRRLKLKVFSLFNLQEDLELLKVAVMIFQIEKKSIVMIHTIIQL
jgi:hypothetical protein